MPEELLEVLALKTYFQTDEGTVKAVDGVDFAVDRNQTLGIVGESGCGKSMTALSIMRLIASPGKIVEGAMNFKGRDLRTISEEEMRTLRGNSIAMIFQEPMTSLNPVFTVGEQIAETIRIHEKASTKAAWDKAVDMLKQVGVPSPEKRARQFPFELSGGMRQRVMIAMALACGPELLIADEPTTALDVTIQAQILELIRNLQKELGMAMILITHDLGVVWETCEFVVVMYAGKIVEYANVASLFTLPLHPYTVGLLNSSPRMEQGQAELTPIPGSVPSPFNMPEGCSFEPRCLKRLEKCKTHTPHLVKTDQHQVRCWLYDES
ncbi:oligopeptide transport ATP-binding protein OppD [Peptococcaceae bacterium CEB3]|nr:oligopeptide transport ATP-binding protein OppD [Peptococcaceae bacterium CEB3]